MTPSGSSIKQAIRQLYGRTIEKELLELSVSSASEDTMDVDDDASDPTWSAEVFFTSPNYQAKKVVFLLFINREFSCLVR